MFLIPKDFLSKTTKEHLADIQKSLQITHEIAKQNLESKQIQQKSSYDKRAEVPQFKLGDKVLLQNNSKEIGKSKKLSPKYKGPYRIVLVGPPFTFQLMDLQTQRFCRVWLMPIGLNHTMTVHCVPQTKLKFRGKLP